MLSRRLAPALVLVSSSIALTALVPACSAKPTDNTFLPGSGGGGHQGQQGDDGGSSSGDDGGGGGPSLNLDGGKGPTLDSGCATATAAATRSPVYMLIVLDGSGSMGQDNKWKAIVPALDSIFDQIQTENDDTLGVGLIAFSDKKDGSCTSVIPGLPGPCGGPYPSSADVSIAFVDQAQHDKLRNRIDPSAPGGGTPTHAALTGGYGELESFAPAAPLQPGGKKVLVIMTDGVPTDGAASQDFSAASGELTKAAPQGPITTFVVGVGPFPSTNTQGYDPAFLGQLAQAGGAAPAGCNPTEASNLANLCYFQVTPNGKPVAQLTQEFIDAINAIRGQVASCEFNLEKPDGGGQVDPTKVNVIYTDAQGVQHVLLEDPQNGWTYDDPKNPTKVILHGSDCSQVKADAKGKISIILGCETQVAK